MSKRLFFVCASLAVFLLGLSACTPTCDPAALLPPDLVSPSWSVVLDPSAVTLEWSYPEACQPEQYEIIMSLDVDRSLVVHDVLVPGNITTWTAPALDPAEEYYWQVQAKVGASAGRWALERRSFFTQPFCDAGDLVAPYPLLPENGGIYDRGLWGPFTWEWPLGDCIAEDFRVELSMDPEFIDTTYNGTVGSPENYFYPAFYSPYTPPAATQFWWRVSAYVDGVYGPASYPMTFFTDPVCSGASLAQPEALLPADDAVVDTGTPEFTWSYPDTRCAPEGFHLWVSYTPDMRSIALEADNPDRAFRGFQAGVPIRDCTEYFWQVSVVSEGVESPPSEIRRFVIDTTGSCECDADSLPAPVMTSEPFEVLPDTTAHLSWYNPGGCIPDGAAVMLSQDFEFGVFDVALLPGPFARSYHPVLEPATQYWWKVAYYVEDDGPEIGIHSHKRSFFTGPECTSIAEVMAPELISPADRAVVNTLTPFLSFQPGDPGCIPDSYLLDLQKDPTFGGTNLMGDFSIPSTALRADPPLENCTRYYWKVSGFQDGRYGPESEPWSFFVDQDGSCPPPGLAGLTKVNTFCRAGTYPEYFPPLHTYESGDPVLAVARNFFNTYLKLVITDKDGKPIEPWVYCWSLLDAFSFDQEDQVYSLPVDNPPPTPIPTEAPLLCAPTLGPKDCAAAGGTYYSQNQYCQCPN